MANHNLHCLACTKDFDREVDYFLHLLAAEHLSNVREWLKKNGKDDVQECGFCGDFVGYRQMKDHYDNHISEMYSQPLPPQQQPPLPQYRPQQSPPAQQYRYQTQMFSGTVPQEPSFNGATGGMPRRSPPYGDPVDADPMMIESDTVITCKVCGTTVCGVVNYEQHCQGRQHQNRLKLWNGAAPAMVDTGNLFLRCDVCDVTVTSRENYEAHIAGVKHKRMMARSELFAGGSQPSARSTPMRAPESYCSTCGAMYSDLYENHVESAQHQRAMRNLRAQAQQMGDGQPDLYCALCSFQARTEKEFMDHKFSNQHFQGMLKKNPQGRG